MKPGADPAPRETDGAGRPPASLDVRRLMAGRETIELVLDGMRYTLRITRQGKLILTK